MGNHPLRQREGFTKEDYNWDEYLDYTHNQIEEPMTKYGKIDILWLDYSFDDYSGERWGASELIARIRKHQPGIILNNRLVQNHGVSGDAREFTGYGDFETPELIIHALVNCVSKNGNLLLNAGPDSQGTIPLESRNTLKSAGHIDIGNQEKTIEEVVVVNTGEKEFTSKNWWGNRTEEYYYINVQSPTYKTYTFPDEINTVFKIVYED